MKGVSIIICCYNSSERLPKTIEYIAKQNIPLTILWEVIIIDNASTDDTLNTAIKEWKKYFLNNIEFCVIKEERQGLSYARQTGIENARYGYIVFCDDDNWLAHDYIYNAFNIMESNDRIGILGGRSEPVSNSEIPYWFTTYSKSYAVGVLSLNSGKLSDGEYVWGAGMVLRKSILNKLMNAGFKHLLSDRIGNSLSSSGDLEICYWFLLVNYKLWYDENLNFKHFIPNNRLKKDYLKKIIQGNKEAEKTLLYYIFYLSMLKENPSLKRKLIPLLFHAIKFVYRKELYSKLYLAMHLPLKYCCKFDYKFYNIKKAVNNYMSLNE